MNDEQKLRQKYTELKIIDQNIRQIHKHLQDIENQILEVRYLKQSMDDFKNVKEGTEVLVPVSNGIFAKAALNDNKELLVNVGANTVVTKSVNEVKDLMDNNLNEIKKAQTKFLEDLQKLSMKAAELEKELNDLMPK